MRRSFTLAAIAAVALFAAGCGSGGKTQNADREVRAVVTQFALSHDARACDLLTDNAVQDVYGGFTDPIPKARANCRAHSRRFHGQPVKITQVKIVNDTTAKVGATTPDGKIAYTVTVRKNGSRWRIDQITQAKVRKF